MPIAHNTWFCTFVPLAQHTASWVTKRAARVWLLLWSLKAVDFALKKQRMLILVPQINHHTVLLSRSLQPRRVDPFRADSQVNFLFLNFMGRFYWRMSKEIKSEFRESRYLPKLAFVPSYEELISSKFWLIRDLSTSIFWIWGSSDSEGLCTLAFPLLMLNFTSWILILFDFLKSLFLDDRRSPLCWSEAEVTSNFIFWATDGSLYLAWGGFWTDFFCLDNIFGFRFGF